MPDSLGGAIAALEADHAFLLRGDVFNADFIRLDRDETKEYDRCGCVIHSVPVYGIWSVTARLLVRWLLSPAVGLTTEPWRRAGAAASFHRLAGAALTLAQIDAEVSLMGRQVPALPSP